MTSVTSEAVETTKHQNYVHPNERGRKKDTFGTAAWKLMLLAGEDPSTENLARIMTMPGFVGDV